MEAQLWSSSIPAGALRLLLAGPSHLPERRAYRASLVRRGTSAEARESAAATLRAALAAAGHARALAWADNPPAGACDDGDAQEVLPGVFVGPLAPAESREWQRRHGWLLYTSPSPRD